MIPRQGLYIDYYNKGTSFIRDESHTREIRKSAIEEIESLIMNSIIPSKSFSESNLLAGSIL